MAKLMSYLSIPLKYLVFLDPEGVGGIDFLKREVIYWSMYMLIIGLLCFFSMTGAKKSFGTLTNNVTYKIRNLLYDEIL